MTQHQSFDAFGNMEFNTTALTLGGTELPQIWAGHQCEAAIDLYHMQARWYDPRSGRFISLDPTRFEAGDANLYRYVGNDAVNAVDPTGLEEVNQNSIILSEDLINSVNSYFDINAAIRPSFTFDLPTTPQVTKITQVGGKSLGDYIYGDMLETSQRDVHESDDWIEALNLQLSVTISGLVKDALDIIGPAPTLVDEIVMQNPGIRKYLGRTELYPDEFVELLDPSDFARVRGRIMGTNSNAPAFRSDAGTIYLDRSRGSSLLRDTVHESVHGYDFGPGGLFEGRSALSLTPRELWRVELRAKSAEILFDPSHVPFGNIDDYYRALQKTGASPF